MVIPKRTHLLYFLICLGTLPLQFASAQDLNTIKWLTFDQLDDSLKINPKKVFVNFYADWCTYCHKMDRITFQDAEVAELLNSKYYAVKMNVESKDTIHFGYQVFVNERIKKRNPVHQIALLMASKRGKPFSLPAMVLLDEKFEATERYFQYLNPKQLKAILEAN